MDERRCQKGPFEVRKRISAAVYLIALLNSRNTIVVNVDRLKPCVERDDGVMNDEHENDALLTADNDEQAENVVAIEPRVNDSATVVTQDSVEQPVTHVRPQRRKYKPNRYDEYCE
jgi:hypothetical protein